VTKKELIDKYVHWALIYYDMNGEIPISEVLKEVGVQVTHLAVMMNGGCKSHAAKKMRESRTTISERLRLKGQYSEAELREIAGSHSVEFVSARGRTPEK
jgi:hypothetical protein